MHALKSFQMVHPALISRGLHTPMPTEVAAPALNQIGSLVHECIDQNLQLLNIVSEEDFKKGHEDVQIGSVIFKGSVAGQLQRTMQPVSLITESYKHAIHIQSGKVVLDNSKVFIVPMDESNRNDVIEFTKNLKADLTSLLKSKQALGLDLYMRFPPRDPAGLEFDVQTTLRKELKHAAKNYIHYSSIVTALMKHMKYEFENNIEMPSTEEGQ